MENKIKISANQDEINLYCHLGEALLKTQSAEQALSYSITLKINPAETKERADEIIKQHQTYTLGKAIKIAIDEKLYKLPLQEKLTNFLAQRNWLIHKVIVGNEEDFNAGKIKEELLDKIKSVADEAESIQREIEYDMLNFCSSKGKDMPKIRERLQLQDQGVRIRG